MLVPKVFGGIMMEEKSADPEEISDAVLLLVSEQARWVTGQYVAASGGLTA
jgi:NAD(P)-dependent dehydrogenase (short-subunit alcohol dehydrogenase family)